MGKRLDARGVANRILSIAEEEGAGLTPLQLMKLTYLSHAWMLAIYDKPLFKNKIQAWPYGPVIPDVYFAFNKYGRGQRLAPHPNFEWRGDVRQEHIVQEVWRVYGHLGGWQLSALTHAPGTPWDTIWKSGGEEACQRGFLRKRIPDHLIKAHYDKIKNYGTTDD